MYEILYIKQEIWYDSVGWKSRRNYGGNDIIETIIEVLIIAGTLVCASLLMRKDALKARRVYAIAFVLLIAVCLAFGVAQGAVAAGIFYATLSFSPIEVLSLVAVIYWISFITEKGKMFNKVIGE